MNHGPNFLSRDFSHPKSKLQTNIAILNCDLPRGVCVALIYPCIYNIANYIKLGYQVPMSQTTYTGVS